MTITRGQIILKKGRIAAALVISRRVSPFWSCAFAVTRCPCDQVYSPVLLRCLLLTQSGESISMGETTSKIVPSHGGSRAPHGFLGLPESITEAASRSVQPFLQGSRCVQQTDRQTGTHTDHAVIGNESVPIQLAQCWFPGLAIFNAIIYKYIFSNKIYRSNFIKHYSKTVMVWNYQNVDCSLKNKFIVLL